MKCKILFTVLFPFLLTGVVGGQSDIRWLETPQVGIAVGDATSAPLVNLAAIGVGNSMGLGWSGYYDWAGLSEQTFHAVMGRLSYGYRNFSDINDHEIGLGFPMTDGVYLGSGIRWISGEKFGVNGHALYRPLSWLSLGLKGESLNLSPWMDFGAAWRPLMFSDHWRSRLTLFYDGRVNPSGGYENLAAGFKTSPLDSLEIYGHWDFRSEKIVTGINFSWNRLLIGGNTTVYGEGALTEGQVQGFASLKKMPSLDAHKKTLVIYDAAEVITDTPRNFDDIGDFSLKAPPARSLYDFLMDIEGLIHSRKVDAVLFNRQGFFTSFSNMIEIEMALKRLKDAGKKIYFYDNFIDSKKYALAASVADGIILNPQGSLDLTGFGVTKLYFKDLLAEYGVEIHNFKSHEYKTAYDNLSESGMSDAQRESLEFIYAALQEQMDRMILTGRKDKLKNGLDDLYSEGFRMSAHRAEETGLVDDLMYSDQIDQWVKEQEYRVEFFSQSHWDMEYEWIPTKHPNIAVIYANGGIMMGEGRQGEDIGAESLGEAIREARLNPLIKAIVLRVNSGGGSALASDIIAREVALCSEGSDPKPVVVSMGAMAASGGYMISAPGTHVLATPATITGSIGVITIFPDLSGLLERFKVTSDFVTPKESGESPNIFRELSQSEEARFHDLISQHYDAFVDLVAINRDMEIFEVNQVAQGRVWTGEQAMDRGLVDDIGGLKDAIELAKDMADLHKARVVEINPGRPGRFFPDMPNILATFLGIETEGPEELLPEDIRDVLDFYKKLAAYERGEALYLMPYTIKEMGLAAED